MVQCRQITALTQISYRHTYTHVLFYQPFLLIYFAIIYKLFTLNLPALACYPHLKFFQNPKSKLRTIFSCFTKTLKILSTNRGPSPPQTNIKTLLRCTNTFLEQSVCGLVFFIVQYYDCHRGVHIFIYVFLEPIQQYSSHTHTETHTASYHAPRGVISFGYPLKATENRCFSCLQVNTHHTCNTFPQ